MNGNSFDQKTFKVGHARKVWREIRHVYPGGGKVSNVADWVEAGKIPAGTPLKFDMAEKTIEAYTKADITGAEDVATLGINAYSQEDAVITSNETIATLTAVYDGEIYSYMLDSEVAEALNGVVPHVIYVQ